MHSIMAADSVFFPPPLAGSAMPAVGLFDLCPSDNGLRTGSSGCVSGLDATPPPVPPLYFSSSSPTWSAGSSSSTFSLPLTVSFDPSGPVYFPSNRLIAPQPQPTTTTAATAANTANLTAPSAAATATMTGIGAGTGPIYLPFSPTDPTTTPEFDPEPFSFDIGSDPTSPLCRPGLGAAPTSSVQTTAPTTVPTMATISPIGPSAYSAKPTSFATASWSEQSHSPMSSPAQNGHASQESSSAETDMTAYSRSDRRASSPSYFHSSTGPMSLSLPLPLAPSSTVASSVGPMFSTRIPGWDSNGHRRPILFDHHYHHQPARTLSGPAAATLPSNVADRRAEFGFDSSSDGYVSPSAVYHPHTHPTQVAHYDYSVHHVGTPGTSGQFGAVETGQTHYHNYPQYHHLSPVFSPPAGQTGESGVHAIGHGYGYSGYSHDQSYPATFDPSTSTSSNSSTSTSSPTTLETADSLDHRLAILKCLAETGCPSMDELRRDRDRFLVVCRNNGFSYKDIRSFGQFREAESTLRGRYRTLTKTKNERVRKPVWAASDVAVLMEGVRTVMGLKVTDSIASLDPGKVAWKKVAEHITAHGGTYRFGFATCKKKWIEVRDQKNP